MGKAECGKHARLIECLEQRLLCGNVRYDSIEKNVEYGKKNRVIGEIDVVARKGRYELYFEVKSTPTQKGYYYAQNQLKRIKDKYAEQSAKQFYFYVTYWGGVPAIMRVKP